MNETEQNFTLDIERLKRIREEIDFIISKYEKRSKSVPHFMTIREVAKTGLIAEYRLRVMVAEKRCPGIYCGNRFRVDYNALVELLKTSGERI